jgi:hypothetical protein
MIKNKHIRTVGEINPEQERGYFIERRKYPRFTPGKKIYILHANFGSVTDISIGGLSYIYCSWKEDSTETVPDKGTIFNAEEYYLDDIPLVKTGDDIIMNSSSISPQIKKRRIRFSELTEKQVIMLELFLLANVDIPEVKGRKPINLRPIATIENSLSL